ncbi:MAG: hypothetical protein CW716_04800 [Candidatus Bathyarchaeum sp.]|nr:MAG: hypothetical protein CW716_04800 [Candidatus Bathyarchaeum sp.]
MKQTWIIAASIITLVALIGTIYCFAPIIPESSEIKLNINNATALTNGLVSFNVTLADAESAVIESVFLNNTSYAWTDGSNETSTILKGETKHWSVNIGDLQNGTNIQIVVETPSKSATENVTVQGQPPENSDETGYIYDNYGGVGLFPEGIHVIATTQDPTTIRSDYELVNSYWEMLANNETTTATKEQFISILLSRGDKTTGGYAINVESFAWLESYPVKFRFQVNITDPADGTPVTQALTTPLVLVPIGKLTPGEYNIEVNITWFTETVNENGTTTYTPIMTFAPIQWTQTLTISDTQNPAPSTTFNVTVNGNQASDLTVQVNLSNNITEADAEKITEAAFLQTMGEQTIHELDTLTVDGTTITAHYKWGFDEADMGHVFDVTVDLSNQTITITHCR